MAPAGRGPTLPAPVAPVAVAGYFSVMAEPVVPAVRRCFRARRPARAATVAVPGRCRCGVLVVPVVPAARVRSVRPGWRRLIR